MKKKRVIPNLRGLITLHKQVTGRVVTYEILEQATGIRFTRLRRFAQNKTDTFDAAMLAGLCSFFGCGIEQVLLLIDAEEEESQ